CHSTSGLHRIAKKNQLRVAVSISIVREDLCPRGLNVVQHERDEEYTLMFFRRLRGRWCIGLDTRSCTRARVRWSNVIEEVVTEDQTQYKQNHATAESHPCSAEPTARASPIFDVRANLSRCPSHRVVPRSSVGGREWQEPGRTTRYECATLNDTAPHISAGSVPPSLARMMGSSPQRASSWAWPQPEPGVPPY